MLRYDEFGFEGQKTTSIEEVLMADLTEEQRKSYWRYNIKLTTILLVIWFVVTYLISGLWAGWLNQFSFLGFPLGYYMAAQGSLAIFVIEIAVYAYLMNKLDIEYGIQEGDEV
jgi:putative solute:sodium symporter small subunit